MDDRKKALLSGIATEKAQRCTARTKVCRRCGYRFEAGDESWKCPECGESRRCLKDAVEGRRTCRIHGSLGGRPRKKLKWDIPLSMADDYFEATNNPDFMSLMMNIGIAEARTAELLRRYGMADSRGAHERIIAIVKKIAMIEPEKSEIDPDLDRELAARGRAIVDWDELDALEIALLDAVQPVALEAMIWNDIAANLELTRRLNDTERRYHEIMDDMVPYADVRNTLGAIVRLALKYIPAPEDQAAFAEELRERGRVEI